MHKIQRMDPLIGPPKCLVCERGNVPDDPDLMDDFFVVDLERDVNWGDPCYICKYCAEKIARMLGFVDAEAVTQLQDVIDGKNDEIHQLGAVVDSQKRRIRAIQHGKKGAKSVKRQMA